MTINTDNENRDSQPLWHWSELCEALALPVVPGPDITGVSIDSRTCQPGDLFIALTGDPGPRFNPSQRSQRDGHSYVADALKNGAAGVLVHDKQSRDCPQLQVTDTLDALWELGRAGRQRLSCPIVAVTGSSGKTTTKSMLTAALNAFATSGSLNNHLGVPLSLARTPRDSSTCVFEIGTNHPGEIAPLAQLVQPQVTVVLNVHPAHAANFASLEELRTEKLSIVRGLTPGGILVVEDQVDDSEVAAQISRLRFGTAANADVQLLQLEEQTATYRVGDRKVTAHVPGGGLHRARSLAAVLAVCVALGRDLAAACSLTDALLPTGRGTASQVAGINVIDDSYNANPASMKAALESLGTLPGRRYAVLGEMLELGDDSASYHRELKVFCDGLDGVFCVGEGMRALAETLDPPLLKGFWQDSSDDLISSLVNTLEPADSVLVKGSNRVFWTSKFVQRLQAALSN